MLSDESENMVRILRGGNINNEKYEFKNNDLFISSEYVKKDLYLTKNTLITPAVSSLEQTGKIARIDKDFGDVVVGGFVLRLHPILMDDTFSKFYLNILSSEFHRNNCRSITRKSGQAFYNLSRQKLLNLPIVIPPLEEQKRIVIKLKELLPHIEQYNIFEEELNNLNEEFPKKIKDSILQEAIQGKLVPQDSNDEPASVLLEKIREEKEQLIKDKKIKRNKNESFIFKENNHFYEKIGKNEPVCIDGEIPFDIPYSWEWVRLNTISQINPRNKVNDELEVSFIPMYLIDESYSNSYTYEIKKWKDIKKGYTHFAKNDIAIAKITPCFENLKSVIFYDLKNDYGAGTTELHIIRSYSDSLSLEYLLFIFKSPYFIKNGEQNFTGTAGQKRIGKKFVENCLIPLPPLSEQLKIVRKINYLFEEIF